MLITTRRKDEIIDLTDIIQSEIDNMNVKNGLCIVFAKHTTCCLTTADLDPGTDLDFLDAVRKILPNMNYRHPHDPSHAPDHILSSIIGPGVTIPIESGQLSLGVWQRIILVELDGPRKREIEISIVSGSNSTKTSQKKS